MNLKVFRNKAHPKKVCFFIKIITKMFCSLKCLCNFVEEINNNKNQIKMETTIKIQTEQKNLEIELEIDNSKEFKDLTLTTSNMCVEKEIRTLRIQIDKTSNEIEINGIKLSGIILQTFKQFITQ